MKKAFLILLGLLLVGVIGHSISPNNVFIGVAAISVGGLFLFSAIVLAAKLIEPQMKQKEERINRLEEEVASLKENKNKPG